MGVDFSHCDARWSYFDFHDFRCKLAKEIGLHLEEMKGFGGDQPWDGIDDPIVPLLNHSDCDGILTPEECGRVYPRLVELVARWNDNDFHKKMALELAWGDGDRPRERGKSGVLVMK